MNTLSRPAFSRDKITDAVHAPWKAELALRFTRREGRSVLVARRHVGPLIVQKALYPEGDGICHAIVVHPPGGIAGGDELRLVVDVGEGAHAFLTTPAAGKWYKAGGTPARQDADFTVTDGAVLEWLPQETIVFDAARAEMDWDIKLEGRAVFAGWDMTCLGRRASGETFRSGAFRQSTRLFRNGTQIWGDIVVVKGSDPLLRSVIGLNGKSVFGTMIIAAGPVPPDVLDQCRAVSASEGDGGVTALPEIFSARYLGQSAERGKAYFAALWAVLRPWYAAKPARRPRIWDT